MIVSHLQIQDQRDRTRVTACVRWEKPASDLATSIYFDVPTSHVPSRTAIAGALLICVALPAVHRGEKRLVIEASVDPALPPAVRSVLSQLSAWYGYPRDPIEIIFDAETPAADPKHLRTASFFSGGVDSFYTLLANRETVPESHPFYIRDAILAYGFDIGWKEDGPNFALFEKALERLGDAANHAEVNLLPVYTNVRRLNDDSNFWAARWHGMVLSGVAHMLSGKLTDVLVPGTNDLWHYAPWGSSPLIEPGLSTTNVRLHHHGVDKTRLEKVRLLTRHPFAVRSVRVCNRDEEIPATHINCGTCEKCVRTKLELLLCGVLDRSDSFADSTLSSEMLSNITAFTDYQASEYEELIEPLEAHGHRELAESASDIVKRWKAYRRWRDEENWKGLLKRLGRRYILRSAPKVANPSGHPVRS